MIIIKVASGNASTTSLMASLPEILNTGSIINITPYDDDFILSMNSTRSAILAVKQSPLSFTSKHGPCTINLSPWTLEFKSHSLAAGNYQWIRLSNLPLHCWNWESIISILRPIGDLIYVQKREEASLKFLRVMARLKKPLAFPMQLIVDVGMRSFLVLLEDSGFPSLRSKISHANVIPVKPVESLEANMSSHVGPAPPPPNNRTSTKLHPDLKGKAPAFASPSTDISGKHVELGSMLSQSVQCFPTEEVVNAGDRQENSNLVVGVQVPMEGTYCAL